MGGGFYASRLSVDLRKNSGLVYSVGSDVQAGKTRSVYFVRYASDPDNVTKASDIVVRELKAMQTAPASAGRTRPRQGAAASPDSARTSSSVARIARGFTQRRDLDLPLDEPTIAARHYIALGPAEVQAAFQKWMRPDDLVRVSQGPPPQ